MVKMYNFFREDDYCFALVVVRVASRNLHFSIIIKLQRRISSFFSRDSIKALAIKNIFTTLEMKFHLFDRCKADYPTSISLFHSRIGGQRKCS